MLHARGIVKTLWTVAVALWGSTCLCEEFRHIHIQLGQDSGAIEERTAALLKERLTESGGGKVTIGHDAIADTGERALLVLFGVAGNHAEIGKRFESARIASVTDRDPGPEGFHIKCMDSHVLVAAAADNRGSLYAVGELLRRIRILPNSFEVPLTLDVRTAPAFEIRGTQFGQSGVAKNLAKVRDWTEAETQRAILDDALAGANTFDVNRGPLFDFLKSFDLLTQDSYGPNIGSGPDEWLAEESIGRTGYLCPSVPEARQALLDKAEAYFSGGAPFDLIKFVGGDGGGCECDKCDPYGLTFILLCEDMAKTVHKYGPNTRIWFTNQKFDDADDQAIFKYLQEEPREWLWAWGYGPGSDAMSWQPGHRQTHRMDLFRYPGFGPFDRYNQEIIHQLPPQQTLLHYNELTHWRYSQHGYVQMYPRPDKNGDLPPWQNHFIYERRPDQALTMVYDRLTFYAWPRFYHWLFGEINRYGVGDVTHSSGHHDHFNQWMWQRLLWAPQTSVDDVVKEYCEAWFGEAAAPSMAQALFQLEENLEENPNTPITEKSGIDRYYDLVAEAGKTMPPHLMKNNWIWREYMQKGALDKYVKLKVAQQTALQAEIEEDMSNAVKSADPDLAVREALQKFGEMKETPAMVRLREEAGVLGEESNTLFGVRNEGYFNLEHDFIGLGWLKRQLERSLDAKDRKTKAELLGMIVDYENPGEGGFYDNLGTYNPCPNVINGSPYDHGQPFVAGMLDEGNRPSQKSMHSTQEQAQGVTLRYRNLDPKAAYRIRLTLVRPWFQERYAMRMNQKSQTIYADDTVLAKDVELPLQMSDFFTYDIPMAATKDGELVIRMEKAPDMANGDRVSVEQWRNSGGWGTLLSEAWLIKK